MRKFEAVRSEAASLAGRLPDPPPPPIGHNLPPKLATWTEFCWAKAQAEAWKTPPIEVVRRRVAAATALGLSYRDYTSVLLDRGAYVRAVVFAGRGVLTARTDPTRLNAAATTKLGRIQREKAFAIALNPSAEEAASLDGLGLGGWRAAAGGRDVPTAIRTLLDEKGVKPDAAVMVGGAQ
ncbi:MAG: hypothetical protein RIM80_25570, partial [Alphaproteobacteria bacterium]